MTMSCDIILQWGATPEQLAALGAALWRWGNRATGAGGIYQHLDNQPLADLIAGKLPASNPTPWRGDRRSVHFWLRGDASPDRAAIIDSLRREIPAEGVEDVVINGKSWNRME